jgi:light-regulated signal transduction histidine kinase (bacteriophytochrome)
MAFGMVSDISERRKAAGDLERVNEELRRSYTEMEQFAHVASHDLQEPLRMVTSYLQLIERRYDAILDQDGREFIHFAVDGAKRMKALIRDLLDFSRTGTGTANRQTVNAGFLLENALSNLKTTIDESGAQITADPLPDIAVDPGLYSQVFQNLVANAIKFQNGPEPCVHISAERRAGDWIFSVHDNGIGIESQHLDRIFRIFERLHPVEEYSGSGIGLAIARKIVEKHGGKIWVESQPGIGSTFHFSISAEMALARAAIGGRNESS